MENEDNQITYNRILDLFVCKSCHCCIRSEPGLISKHLRQSSNHNMNCVDAKRIENDSLSMKEKAPRLSKSEADLSVRYREAMKKENGYHSPLPIINFLQVTQGVKCFICNAIMKNTQKAEHIKKCIGCTSSSFVEVQMQSAFGSKKTKFFEVFDDSEKPNWLFDYISRSEKHGLDMSNNNMPSNKIPSCQQ